eukprot:5823391-Pleurochrysis_carterae.AAC.1
MASVHVLFIRQCVGRSDALRQDLVEELCLARWRHADVRMHCHPAAEFFSPGLGHPDADQGR